MVLEKPVEHRCEDRDGPCRWTFPNPLSGDLRLDLADPSRVGDDQRSRDPEAARALCHADGGWILNGQEQADLRGCVDIDFEVSPATNTLPIRRLDPKMGETRDIRVAWVRFPELRVEPTRQRYTRVAGRRYRFENLDSGYSVEILVDDAGLVLEYPDLWARSPNP